MNTLAYLRANIRDEERKHFKICTRKPFLTISSAWTLKRCSLEEEKIEITFVGVVRNLTSFLIIYWKHPKIRLGWNGMAVTKPLDYGFQVLQSSLIQKPGNHCTIDLLFDWFGLVRFANKKQRLSVVIQLIPNQSNRRSIVQWYSPFSIPCKNIRLVSQWRALVMKRSLHFQHNETKLTNIGLGCKCLAQTQTVVDMQRYSWPDP